MTENTAVAEISGFTEKLSSYTMTQLNELLEDDEQLSKIVQDMEEARMVQQAKHVTLAGNRSLAEQNLLLQPQLDLRKNNLTGRYRSLQELFEAYQLRRSTLDHNLGCGSLDTLLALLQAEGAKIEEETEKMADLFLDGGRPLDSFIDDYQSKRKLSHLRRVKIDRLREIVLRGLRTPRASTFAPAPAAQPDTNGYPIPMPRRSPTQQASTTASEPPAPSGYAYPSVSPHTGFASPFLPQFSPILPEGPPPHLGPQPGFILQ